MDVLRPITLVKGHIKQLNLQCSAGWGDVASGQELRDAKHLLKSMEMIQRRRHEVLMDHIISARRHVEMLVPELEKLP